jgi:multiple sugar transport system substrate-binding protein
MSTKRTRRGGALALTAAAALTIAGCATSGGSSSSSPLTLPSTDPTATIHVVSVQGLQTNDMQDVVNAFEKAHPTIKIVWQTVPFDSETSILDTDIANKQGNPDVYYADEPRIPALVARGEIQDLTSIFGSYKDQFNPSAWDANLVDGKLYATPIADSTQLLYYNKDLLAKAGITPPPATPTSPITWDQLAADAVKAHAARATYGMAFGQPDTYYQLEPLPVELGGSKGATGQGNLTPDITSNAWVQAMTWYGKLFSSGASSTAENSTNADPDFYAGKSAFLVDGAWVLPDLQKSTFNWGVAPEPVFQAGGTNATPSGSGSYAMNPFSKNKGAAAIFLKWLSIDNGYVTYRANPELPVSPSGAKAYFAKPIFSTPGGKDAEAIIDYQTAHTAQARLATVGYVEFETIMGNAFADIQSGADPKTTLETAATQLKTAWAKYQ